MNKLEQLTELAKITHKPYASHEDVKKLFLELAKLINNTRTPLAETTAHYKGEMAEDIKAAIQRLDASEAKMRGLISGNKNIFSAELSTLTQQLTDDIKRVEGLIPTLPDLEPLRREISAVRAEIPTIPEPPEPMSAEEVRNRLEVLSGDERLDKSAVKGIEELEKQITEAKSVRVSPAPSRGMFVYIDGVKKGIINTLDFKAGTAMAIAYSEVNGMPTLTFTSSGGSGVTVETPPETPNASTTVFTVTDEPKWVVADGVTYYAGAGYSYAALAVTMDVAPSATIRVII